MTPLVTVEIAPIDDPTAMTDDSASTTEDTPVTVAVLGNDSDPDTPLAVRKINGAPIAVGGSVTVANGSVVLNADGTLTFTPAANFNGTASFDYAARAGLHFQLFDRAAGQNFFQSVTEIPTAGGVGGTATDFDVTALASSLTGTPTISPSATPARSMSRAAAATPSTPPRTTARRSMSTA